MRGHDPPPPTQPDHVDRFGRLGLDHLVIEDELLHESGASAAELPGPGDADVPRFVELLLPRAPPLYDSLLSFVSPVRRRLVRLQPCANLIPKRLLGCVELEIHAINLDAMPQIGVQLDRLRS